MTHTLTYITIALAFAITMALITIIQARKEGHRKMTALANIYDLLEGVADRIERNGNRARANELRAGFARGTGGADLDYLVEQLSAGSEKFNAYIEDQTGGDYPERIWFTPADNNSKSYVRGDLCENERASIVAYLRAQIKRHGILGQIAEEIEQRKDREHKRC